MSKPFLLPNFSPLALYGTCTCAVIVFVAIVLFVIGMTDSRRNPKEDIKIETILDDNNIIIDTIGIKTIDDCEYYICNITIKNQIIPKSDCEHSDIQPYKSD